MFKTRGIQYFFPILAPLLLAGADLLVRSISSSALLSGETIFRQLSLAVIFGCVTIDIWGITTAISKDNSVTLTFVLFLLLHLFLWGFGIHLARRLEIMEKTNFIGYSTSIGLVVVVVISLGVLFSGREYCWRKIQQ